MVRVADRAEAAVGLKVTLIVQFEPAATLVAQVLVCEKSAAFVPEIETPVPVMFSVVAPLLVSVAVCAGLVVWTAWLPKFNDVGETEAAALVPVPVSETV